MSNFVVFISVQCLVGGNELKDNSGVGLVGSVKKSAKLQSTRYSELCLQGVCLNGCKLTLHSMSFAFITIKGRVLCMLARAHHQLVDLCSYFP